MTVLTGKMRYVFRLGRAFFALFAVAWGSAALAETVIDGNRTTPVETSTANNGAADDVLIDEDATVTVANGTALNLDSNNDLTVDGTVRITSTTGGTGALLEAGNTGDFTFSGVMDLYQDEDPDEDELGPVLGEDNTGIEVSGAGVFTGDITLEDGSVIAVGGDDSFGINILSAMTGDISVGGTIQVVGENATGINLAAPLTGDFTIQRLGSLIAAGENARGVVIGAAVTGSVWNNGSIQVSGQEPGEDYEGVDPLPTADFAVGIGASIGEGFQNGGLVGQDAQNLSASISSTLAPYAVLISPSIAVAPADIVLSSPNVANNAFGFINLGRITANPSNDGEDVAGVRVEGFGGFTTTIADGFLNFGAIGGFAVGGGDAAGISFGAGASTPVIDNQGSIVASSSNDTISNAYGLLIEAGASVLSLKNSGSVTATATAEFANATAIRDLTGLLATIENTGTIAAAIQPQADGELDDSSRAIAIDVSAATSTVTVTSADTIRGDILFGSGDDSLSILAYTDDPDVETDDDKVSTITGLMEFGLGADVFNIGGGGTFSGGTDFDGTLTINVTDGMALATTGSQIFASTLATGAAGILAAEINTDTDGTTPFVVVDGTLSFASGADLSLILTQFVGVAGDYLIAEAGTITIADGLAALTENNAPWIYDATFTLNDDVTDSISASIDLKTAEQLGLNAQQALLYDAVLEIMGEEGNVLDDLLAPIGTQDEFLAAFDTLLPDTSLGSLRSTLATTEARADALSRRSTVGEVRRRNRRNENGAWTQYFGGMVTIDETAEGQGIDGQIAGQIFGFDMELFEHAPVGLFLAASGTEFDNPLVGGEGLNATSVSAGAYATVAVGPVFAQVMAGYGYTTFSGTRVIATPTATAELESEWSGTQFDTELRLGAEIMIGDVRIVPIIGYSYVSISEDGRRESGGGIGYDLVYVPLDADVSSAFAEVTVSYDAKLRNSLIFRPELWGGVREIIDGADQEVVAQFSGGTELFVLNTSPLPESQTVAGMSLGLYGHEATLRAGYEYQTGDITEHHIGTLNVVFKF